MKRLVASIVFLLLAFVGSSFGQIYLTSQDNPKAWKWNLYPYSLFSPRLTTANQRVVLSALYQGGRDTRHLLLTAADPNDWSFNRIVFLPNVDRYLVSANGENVEIFYSLGKFSGWGDISLEAIPIYKVTFNPQDFTLSGKVQVGIVPFFNNANRNELYDFQVLNGKLYIVVALNLSDENWREFYPKLIIYEYDVETGNLIKSKFLWELPNRDSQDSTKVNQLDLAVNDGKLYLAFYVADNYLYFGKIDSNLNFSPKKITEVSSGSFNMTFLNNQPVISWNGEKVFFKSSSGEWEETTLSLGYSNQSVLYIYDDNGDTYAIVRGKDNNNKYHVVLAEREGNQWTKVREIPTSTQYFAGNIQDAFYFLGSDGNLESYDSNANKLGSYSVFSIQGNVHTNLFRDDNGNAYMVVANLNDGKINYILFTNRKLNDGSYYLEAEKIGSHPTDRSRYDEYTIAYQLLFGQNNLYLVVVEAYLEGQTGPLEKKIFVFKRLSPGKWELFAQGDHDFDIVCGFRNCKNFATIDIASNSIKIYGVKHHYPVAKPDGNTCPKEATLDNNECVADAVITKSVNLSSGAIDDDELEGTYFHVINGLAVYKNIYLLSAGTTDGSYSYVFVDGKVKAGYKYSDTSTKAPTYAGVAITDRIAAYNEVYNGNVKVFYREGDTWKVQDKVLCDDGSYVCGESNCTDGKDNNGNSLIDEKVFVGSCSDGVDNDNDGSTDEMKVERAGIPVDAYTVNGTDMFISTTGSIYTINNWTKIPLVEGSGDLSALFSKDGIFIAYNGDEKLVYFLPWASEPKIDLIGAAIPLPLGTFEKRKEYFLGPLLLNEYGRCSFPLIPTQNPIESYCGELFSYLNYNISGNISDFEVSSSSVFNIELYPQNDGIKELVLTFNTQGSEDNPLRFDIKYWTQGYSPLNPSLHVNVVGSGSVVSSPQGINCPETCMAQFDNGTTITLTANPADGYVFAGWEGDCSACGNNATCNVTVTSDMTCNATFSPIQPQIKVVPSSIDFGMVPINRSKSAGIVISNLGTSNLKITSMRIEGNDYSEFSVNGTCSVILPNKGCTVEVTFSPETEGEKSAVLVISSNDPQNSAVSIPLSGKGVEGVNKLTVKEEGLGVGEISIPGVKCTFGKVCTGEFAKGSNVTIVVNPLGQTEFKGWGGDCSGICDDSNTTCTLEIDRDLTCIVNLELNATAKAKLNDIDVGIITINGTLSGKNTEDVPPQVGNQLTWWDPKLHLYGNAMLGFTITQGTRGMVMSGWTPRVILSFGSPLPQNVVPVKYNPVTGEFINLSSFLSKDRTTIVLDITDNSRLDSNSTLGVVEDPILLAEQTTNQTANQTASYSSSNNDNIFGCSLSPVALSVQGAFSGIFNLLISISGLIWFRRKSQ